MKNGKTRLQRVQVLASGKYKFVKNLARGAKKARKTVKAVRARSRSSKVRKTAKGKFFKNMSIEGFAEDLAWGYLGLRVLGSAPSTLPTVRAIQGLQGYALNRRGKGRLMYAITDLVDLWLAGAYSPAQLGGISSSVSNLLKVRPL